MDHPYKDISEGRLIELDWQAEKRAQARFLRETYNDWQATVQPQPGNTPATVRPQPSASKQLNLFEEIVND